ncbi:50S ribosomal protein L11 methyltransferase [Cytophagaceae bacterium ABcell3]|nr:50S ribosomal protein L11 methyltransferase [Cytophagaceae bacterium ABcell3]
MLFLKYRKSVDTLEYLEVKIKLSPEIVEIIIAELQEIGFDSFAEQENGLDAYIEEGIFSEDILRETLKKYNCEQNLVIGKLENKNWNEEWEKNFDPVIISDQCIIKAPFHQTEENYKYSILLNPRMAFGTGHHETTSMMLQHQMNMEHKGKQVLDAGSGTGILAIMACLRGAKETTAFDIDEWAYDNIFENLRINNCTENVRVYQGDVNINQIHDRAYDIILANINTNILLQDMSAYHKLLAKDGHLVMSGFLEEDLEKIENKAIALGLKKISYTSNNNWGSVVYHNQ